MMRWTLGRYSPEAPASCSDVAVGRSRPCWRGGDLHNRSDGRFLGGVRHRLGAERDMMDAPVNAIDDEAKSLAKLVGQPLVDHAASDPGFGLLAVKGIAFQRALFAARLQRPVDRLDDVAALAEFPQRRLHLVGQLPHARLALRGEAVARQRLQSADAQRPIEVGADLTRLRPQVERSLAGLGEHRPVDPGEALGGDFRREFRSQFEVGLRSQFQRRQLLRAQSRTPSVM